MRRNPAVVGTGQVGYQDELSETYPELAGAAARKAIDDASIEFEIGRAHV